MSSKQRAEELVKLDQRHVIHPLFAYKDSLGIVLEEGSGIRLKDIDGREYIDFVSGLICVNMGWGRQELVDAMAAQASKLGFSTVIRGWSSKSTIECAEKLKRLTPEGLDHFFFCSGGSEANDSAFKIARLYWQSRGMNKYKIISLDNSFHGVTFGAMSATGLGHNRLSKYFEPLVKP